MNSSLKIGQCLDKILGERSVLFDALMRACHYHQSMNKRSNIVLVDRSMDCWVLLTLEFPGQYAIFSIRVLGASDSAL